MLGKGAGRVENQRTNIVKISQNTEKSPGDLRRLVVIQTLVKDRKKTFNDNNNDLFVRRKTTA